MPRLTSRVVHQIAEMDGARRLILLIAAIVSVLFSIAVGAKAAADSTYVRRDTFALHNATERQSHIRDSLLSAADRREVRALLFGLDSSDRCRRGQTNYCQ